MSLIRRSVALIANSSMILLAILAFVVYRVLPTGSLDPWALVEPRAAWVTVILIATLGFTNYVLLKLYGTRDRARGPSRWAGEQ